MSDPCKRAVELMSQLPKELREMELIRLEAAADALAYMRWSTAIHNTENKECCIYAQAVTE